jgi:adenylate cyclase 10
LLGMQGVQECSIGVTTGSCYSGVMGHAKRQEYTVMGRKVNKAARLMVYYPGRVSCDQDTASHSKLNPANFELQEYKELKGIANPGKIYEFVNQENQEDNSVAYFMYPM